MTEWTSLYPGNQWAKTFIPAMWGDVWTRGDNAVFRLRKGDATVLLFQGRSPLVLFEGGEYELAAAPSVVALPVTIYDSHIRIFEEKPGPLPEPQRWGWLRCWLRGHRIRTYDVDGFADERCGRCSQ